MIGRDTDFDRTLVNHSPRIEATQNITYKKIVFLLNQFRNNQKLVASPEMDPKTPKHIEA